MPGLQAALFPQGPSLFTPVTCLSASLMPNPPDFSGTEKNLPIYHPAFIFHFFPVTCFFPPSFSTTPISKLSPANSLLHSYTLVSTLTAMLERPFWRTLRVSSAGCEAGLRPHGGPRFLYSPFAPLHHSFHPSIGFQVLSFCILTHPEHKKFLILNSIP